jgi:predicted alpha/beta superfamily hydrolase
MLLENPYLFKNYIIGSPSVWWDEKHIPGMEAKAKLPVDFAVNIFIAVGADEVPGRDSPRHDIVGQAREMFDR